MGTEIERKFLVRTERLPKDLPEGNELEQGYLSVDPTVRVRLVTGPEGTRHAELTIKGKGLMSRAEFNYPIPDEDAEALLGMCARSLRKVRREDRPLRAGSLSRARSLARRDRARGRARALPAAALARDEVTNDPEYANSRLATPRSAS